MFAAASQWTPATITALIASCTAFLGAIGGIIAVIHGQSLSHVKLDNVSDKVTEVATAVEPVNNTPTTTATTIPRS